MTADPQGLEIHRDGGDGDTVVLLHGFPDTAASWDSIADALEAEGYRVIVAHLRGYTAGSIRPGRGYDAVSLAEDMVATLDALSIDQATLIGHDFGASIAYGTASLAPERVRALVGVAIPHPRTLKVTPALAFKARHFAAFKLPWAARQFALFDFSGVDILYRRWAPNWTGAARDRCVADIKSALRDPKVLEGVLAYYKDLSPKPDRRVTAKLAQPALVVGGGSDIVPAEAFAASRSAFTGPFDSVVFDQAGHWPHRESEPQFIDAVVAFLADLP